MRRTLAAVAGVVCAATPAAYAQGESQLLNNLGDHIAIPGVSGRQSFVYDFQLTGFQSKGERLFAIGTLSSGNLPSPQQVAIPIRGTRHGDGEGHGRGSPETPGGFGALQRAVPTQPTLLGSEQEPRFKSALYQHASPAIILAQTTQTCQVLNLVLQPLNLNLLGLVVDLQAVNLDVAAVAGAGNLLGNLVCALAGLLG